MSTSIDNSFVKQYERDLIEVFQRQGGFLRNAVRMKTGVVGSTTTFQVLGKGIATTKARHGVITPMNQDHTPKTATLADFYAGDWVDKLDEAKTNIDERMAIARGGAFALGRKVDDQIITALDGTTQPTATITVTSEAAIKASVLGWVETFFGNDVKNDGNSYGIVTPRAWSQMMVMQEFANAFFVGDDGMSYKQGVQTQGKWKDFLGIKWGMHTGLPGKGTATAKCFLFHKDAVGYATGKHAGNNAESDMVSADITWHGDRAAHFVNHMMSGGAVLIDDTGVIEGNLDDTAAIATT